MYILQMFIRNFHCALSICQELICSGSGEETAVEKDPKSEGAAWSRWGRQSGGEGGGGGGGEDEEEKGGRGGGGAEEKQGRRGGEGGVGDPV